MPIFTPIFLFIVWKHNWIAAVDITSNFSIQVLFLYGNSKCWIFHPITYLKHPLEGFSESNSFSFGLFVLLISVRWDFDLALLNTLVAFDWKVRSFKDGVAVWIGAGVSKNWSGVDTNGILLHTNSSCFFIEWCCSSVS
jgi:hypothetical protein